jgi:hypothetical protein
MQANTRKVASHLILIEGEEEIQAAKDNNLYIDKKPGLIVRGIPAQETIKNVYRHFASRTDMTGSPFKLSHREKGICAVNQWREYSKLTSKEFARLNHLPPMLTQLFHQPRYITADMLAAFEWID